ncbi:hypothetical protein [Halobacillus litoralis]|uniref:hypothetical protein n=1 Tax=Halobacillus litoralis TaxID=45668 RepID=UPI001CD250E2|nr:hypothetical protein [Halobacillus litoralis]MCA1021551.1 hypothetical protein [Halobacillus litoralis]
MSIFKMLEEKYENAVTEHYEGVDVVGVDEIDLIKLFINGKRLESVLAETINDLNDMADSQVHWMEEAKKYEGLVEKYEHGLTEIKKLTSDKLAVHIAQGCLGYRNKRLDT